MGSYIISLYFLYPRLSSRDDRDYTDLVSPSPGHRRMAGGMLVYLDFGCEAAVKVKYVSSVLYKGKGLFCGENGVNEQKGI